VSPLRIINAERVKVQFQWEPRDLWIGAFWRFNYGMTPRYYTFHLYVCLVPMLPLHVTVLRETGRPK
jgi:hypothetical protein